VIGGGGNGVVAGNGNAGTMTEIEDDQSSTLAYANPGLGGKYLEAGGGGTGGSNAGNNALFAQAGANGSVSGVVPTGAAFVPPGTVNCDVPTEVKNWKPLYPPGPSGPAGPRFP